MLFAWDALAAGPGAPVDEAATWGFWSWSSLVLALAVVGEVLAIVFVYRVLVRGVSPASTVLWMAVILAAPWFGLLAYYLLPRRLQLVRLRRLQRRERRLREVRPRDDTGDVSVEPEAGGLEALLLQEGGLTDGNRVRWLPGGEQFFAEAAAAIEAAERHVHCVVYILRPDETGLRFLEVLAAAARRGVAVRLCYDSFGSLGLKTSHLAALREAGGRVEAFLPLLWKKRPFTINLRNHRKLLIVDGDVAFVGGRNVGDEYRTGKFGERQQWFDAMVELRGPAVDRLQEIFVQDWCTASEEVLSDTFRPACEAAGDARVAVVCSGPDREHSALWFAIVQTIGEAVRTVDLSSPYLVMPPTLLFALQLAVARGVRVRVHTNGVRSEAAFLYHAQRHHYRRLLESGIEVFETTESYNHAKYLVVDGRHVLVGSANMDLRSAHLNFEVAALVVGAPEFAGEVRATIEERQAEFRRVTPELLPTNPFWRAIDALCGLFSPLM